MIVSPRTLNHTEEVSILEEPLTPDGYGGYITGEPVVVSTLPAKVVVGKSDSRLLYHSISFGTSVDVQMLVCEDLDFDYWKRKKLRVRGHDFTIYSKKEDPTTPNLYTITAYKP